MTTERLKTSKLSRQTKTHPICQFGRQYTGDYSELVRVHFSFDGSSFVTDTGSSGFPQKLINPGCEQNQGEQQLPQNEWTAREFFKRNRIE